jgi:hypothetical protein
MDFLTKDNIGIFLGIIGAVGAIPVFRGYFVGALTYSNSRKLRKLREERDFFVRLNGSGKDVAIYVFNGVLTSLAVLGASLMFHGIEGNPDGVSYVALSDAICGFCIYMVAIWRLGKINRLMRFDKTIKLLDEQIARLEEKLSANRSSSS